MPRSKRFRLLYWITYIWSIRGQHVDYINLKYQFKGINDTYYSSVSCQTPWSAVKKYCEKILRVTIHNMYKSKMESSTDKKQTIIVNNEILLFGTF